MTIETLFLDGPAGRIECLLKLPGGGAPAAAALVCHPHPLFGGSMHNKVVHAASLALAGEGLAVLRFNFRGVGLSAGEHDMGRGETDDARLVIDHLATRFPDLPLVVAGYSFGSFVGLRAGCRHPRATALIGLGIPVTLYDFSFLARCGAPLAIVQGERDQFGPLPLVMALAASLPGGGRVLPVPGAAHNFEGNLEEVAARVIDALPEDLRTTGSGREEP
jgi:uncharacterized protein